jgi:hypothetical protein
MIYASSTRRHDNMAHATVAQGLEQSSYKAKVGGSIPPSRTNQAGVAK